MAVLENGFPFDNVEYDATALGAWLSTRTRGVFSDDEHYAVTAAGGMQINVSAGVAWLKMNEQWGMVAPNPASITLSVDVGDTILNRIDVVCLRIDKNQSVEEVVIKKGELAATPVYPALVRDLNYDEVFLAAISVPAGATELSAAMITDLRGNETYCGVMRDGVTGIPTAQLQAQAEDLIQLLEDAIAGVIDGSQYMLKAGYDPDNVVSEAGGIAPYVDSALANNTNFNVITGTTPPTTAPEDTIFVPVSFSAVSYSKIAPRRPVDEELWLPEAKLVQVRGKAVKDTLYGFGNPKRYNAASEEWELVWGALCYQDGAWNVVQFLIYDSGVWHTKYGTYTETNSTITMGESFISIRYTGSSYRNAAIGAQNDDDQGWEISKFSKVCIDMNLTASGSGSDWVSAKIGLLARSNAMWPCANPPVQPFIAVQPGGGRKVFEFDISQYSGVYTPVLQGQINADVYKIWME